MSGRGPIRVGIVGCGRLAEVGYAPAIAASPAVEAVAVADPDPARRSLLAAATGGRAFSDAEALAARGDVEAVIIASPAEAHLESVRACAALGLPTLLEKPPADRLERAREIAALRPQPLLGLNRRYSLGAGLSGGRRAGEEISVEALIHYRRSSWRPLGDLGDAWLDLGPHLIDLALLVAGPPYGAGVEVEAARIATGHARVELRGPGFNARLGAATRGRWRESLIVRDARGRAIVRRRLGGLPALLRRRAPHPLVASLERQLAAFAAAIDRGSPGGLATAAEGVVLMELIVAARRLAAAVGGSREAGDGGLAIEGPGR